MALTDKLTDIADAIREKTGSTDSLTLDAMPTAIKSIETGTGEVNKLPAFFDNNPYAESLTLTEADFAGVSSIRRYACAGAEINGVSFPDNIRYYGDHMFAQAKIEDFNNIQFSKNANTIPSYMFYFATFNNGNVTIPDVITTIGYSAFENADKVARLQLNNGLVTIENKAFNYAGLSGDLVIPVSVQTIGQNAFSYNVNLTSVTFNGTPSSIDTYVFSTCDKLTDIYVPWAEGAVAGAPWGAANATIHYNS